MPCSTLTASKCFAAFPEYRAALFRLAFLFTRNREDAEDLVQDTLLRACERTGTFRGLEDPGRLYSWLSTILRHLYFNRCRERQSEWNRHCVGWDDTMETRFSSRDAKDNLPEIALFYQYSFDAIFTAFERLEPEQRAVLELVVFEDLSYTEIAERLNLPVGTVRSRLHRARARVSRAVVLWLS